VGGTTSAGIAAMLGYANGRLMGDPKYPNRYGVKAPLQTYPKWDTLSSFEYEA